MHAFRLHETATTFFLLCVLCLRSSFTRNAFLFGASCYVRAIAPATVPSLSQRIGVCGSGGHKQPYYVSGSKCYNLFVLASVVGIWKGMNESRCFSVRVC